MPSITSCFHHKSVSNAVAHAAWLQVKEQVQEFRERQAVISKAESLAASYASREAALATREQKVSEQEDSAQQANAAAEYARTEADAMWQKQKVVSPA